jgi:hypothetical protein
MGRLTSKEHLRPGYIPSTIRQKQNGTDYPLLCVARNVAGDNSQTQGKASCISSEDEYPSELSPSLALWKVSDQALSEDCDAEKIGDNDASDLRILAQRYAAVKVKTTWQPP